MEDEEKEKKEDDEVTLSSPSDPCMLLTKGAANSRFNPTPFESVLKYPPWISSLYAVVLSSLISVDIS